LLSGLLVARYFNVANVTRSDFRQGSQAFDLNLNLIRQGTQLLVDLAGVRFVGAFQRELLVLGTA
jgi:hypothetical protein